MKFLQTKKDERKVMCTTFLLTPVTSGRGNSAPSCPQPQPQGPQWPLAAGIRQTQQEPIHTTNVKNCRNTKLPLIHPTPSR